MMNRYSSDEEIQKAINECLHIEALSNLYRRQRTEGSNVISSETPLLFDKLLGICVNLNTNDDVTDYYSGSYVPLGSVFYLTDELMRILTPYFVRIEIDPLFNKDGKALMKKVRKDVNKLTKFLKNEIGEGTIRMMTRDDAEIIQYDIRGIGYGVQETQPLVGWEGEKTTSEILLQELICIEGKDGLEFLLGGFGPQYFYDFIPKDYAAEALAQCSYSQMSVDDFMKATQDRLGMIHNSDEEKPDVVAAESDSMTCPKIDPMSYEKLNERFNKLSLLEFYVPVVVELSIE